MNPSLVNEWSIRLWVAKDEKEAKSIQRAKIKEFLSEQGVVFFEQNGRICTTIQAINNALIGIGADNERFDFE